MEAKEIAINLITGIEGLITANGAKRVDIASEVVDGLFGTDPTAIVSKVPGLTPDIFEMITDVIKEQVRDRIKQAMEPDGPVGEPAPGIPPTI